MSEIRFEFCYYESWMRDQVIKMFCKEYNNDESQFSGYFDQFYSNKEYNPESIKIVALDGKKVAGFVSFTLWPYMVHGKAARSFQCGNVIVNSDYRGKGLYNKMLDHLDKVQEKHHIDFLIGFPIKPILGLYLKNKWTHLLNIQWYVKVINPLAYLKSHNPAKFSHFAIKRKIQNNLKETSPVYLLNTPEFCKWRDAYKPYLLQNEIYYFYYSNGADEIEFDLKLNNRKYICEMMVGDLKSSNYDPVFIRKGLKELTKAIRKTGRVSILSFALNDQCADTTLLHALKRSLFFKIKKDIFFITKKYNPSVKIDSVSVWKIFRSDLDTW